MALRSKRFFNLPESPTNSRATSINPCRATKPTAAAENVSVTWAPRLRPARQRGMRSLPLEPY